jgi:(4-(4-[2-(gamma-L-glutamylamino)ethyl]phenoxymethyl)furan-2-yl)methanamine synthase
VHLILGHLTPEAYICPTPDGRPASVACARERVARLVCADAEQLATHEVETVAAYLHSEQVRHVEAAARQVSTRFPERTMPIVALGSGAFIACEVAERMGRPVLEMPWSAAERDVAPAAALAQLAAGRRHGAC